MLIRFLIASYCSGVNTSSSHAGHLSAFTLCRITPSTSKSNSTSTYSTQQDGQSRALALMLFNLLGEFFSKLFCPSLYLSQVCIINHGFSQDSYAPAKSFCRYRINVWVFSEGFSTNLAFASSWLPGVPAQEEETKKATRLPLKSFLRNFNALL